MMKTGICISGPAWRERKRSAIPAEKKRAARLASRPSMYIPAMSKPSPRTPIPASSETPVMITQTTISLSAAPIA